MAATTTHPVEKHDFPASFDKSELCFVKEFDKHTVYCYFFNLKELRAFTVSPFFLKMKLFTGKNIEFKTFIKSGTVIMRCVETETSKFRQLWNYYILRKFNLKTTIMATKYRISIELLKQLGVCFSYKEGYLYLYILVFTIAICFHKAVGGFFEFVNNFKK